MPPAPRPLVPSPTPDETRALRQAAHYLARIGTAEASRLLLVDDALAGVLRDQLLDAAALLAALADA